MLRGKNIYFPLDMQPNETATYYIRLVSSYGKQYSVSLIRGPHLHSGDIRESMLQGILIGILTIISLYNIFLGISVKDKLYWHYALANVFTLMACLAAMGFFAYYLPENMLHLVPLISSLSIGLFSVFSSNFNIRILKLKETSKFAYYLMLGTALFGVMVVMVVNIRKYSGITTNYNYVNMSNLLFAITATIAGIIALKKGSKYARYYLIGWTMLLVGILLYALTLAGVINQDVITNNMYIIGSELEVLLLSFALADRYKIMQKEKSELEQSLIFKERDLSRVVTDNRMRHQFKTNIVNHLKELCNGNEQNLNADLRKYITDLKLNFLRFWKPDVYLCTFHGFRFKY